MKTMFEKHKIPMISCGILLVVVVLSSIINFNNLKQNTNKDNIKLETAFNDDKKDDQTKRIV